MAHGVIPPFSNYLVSRDFFKKVPIDSALNEDVNLLGEASNEVTVVCEIAEIIQTITRRAYHDYLAYGFVDLRDSKGDFQFAERRFISLLLAVTLDLDGARDAVGKLLPYMREPKDTGWRTLVGGVMDSNIREVEDELGLLVKEGSKDIYVHTPEEVGFKRLEQLFSVS